MRVYSILPYIFLFFVGLGVENSNAQPEVRLTVRGPVDRVEFVTPDDVSSECKSESAGQAWKITCTSERATAPLELWKVRFYFKDLEAYPVDLVLRGYGLELSKPLALNLVLTDKIFDANVRPGRPYYESFLRNRTNVPNSLDDRSRDLMIASMYVARRGGRDDVESHNIRWVWGERILWASTRSVNFGVDPEIVPSLAAILAMRSGISGTNISLVDDLTHADWRLVRELTQNISATNDRRLRSVCSLRDALRQRWAELNEGARAAVERIHQFRFSSTVEGSSATLSRCSAQTISLSEIPG